MAVVHDPHRPARLAGEERRVGRDHRRVVLLAAERAARLLLDHDDLVGRQVHGPDQRRVHVVGALERAVDLDGAVLARDRDHRLRLDVRLLLVAGPVGALDDEVGGREARVEVAPCDLEPLAGLLRGEGVEDRGQGLRAEGDRIACGPGKGGRGRRDQGDRLGGVPDLVRDECRLVQRQRRDDVLARDVGGGDDHHLRPVEGGVEVDPEQPRVRIGGAHGGAVPRPRHDDVVRVEGSARQLVHALAPEGIDPDRPNPACGVSHDAHAARIAHDR